MSKPRKSRRGVVQGHLPVVSDLPVAVSRKLAFLDEVDALIDWEAVLRPLMTCYATVGRPGADPLVLVKMLLLERWFNLSDPQCELHCNDRLSFRRFVGLQPGETAPDETTLVRFRARLARHGLATAPVDAVMEQLEEKKYIIQTGRAVIVDGTLIRSETNSGATNANNGQVEPDAATLGRKGKPPLHGYKMHAALDAETGLILGETVTAATGDERQQLEVLVQEGDKELLADKGYPSKAVDGMLRRKKVKNRVMRKKPRGRKMSKHAKRRNKAIGKVRGRIEAVFGTLKRTMGLGRAIYRGLPKVAAWCRWTNIAYNLRRLSRLQWLGRPPGLAACPARAGPSL